MPRIFVTRELAIDVAGEVSGHAEVTVFAHDRALTHAELTEGVREADALVVALPTRIDEAVMSQASRLRVIANVAVGFDNIDVAAATARGIWVTNTPDVLTHASAELTWGLLLAAARRIGEGERLVRSERWQGFSPTLLLGTELFGRTLGVLGLGRIGRAVAAIGRGFGMNVIATSGGSRDVVEGVRIVDQETLLRESDVLSLHAPATPQTKHVINRDSLAKMRRGAILVNTSRGSLVDEEALASALSSGQIAAAGLDVFEREPMVHPALMASDRAVLLPHVGSATLTARAAMARLAIRDAMSVLEGKSPAYPVNPEVRRRGAT